MKPTNPLGLTQRTWSRRTSCWSPGQRPGHKVTRFTALLTPGHVNLGAGAPTRQGTDPLGRDWVMQNEVRSANRQALRYWIRFHLLNDKLGGHPYNKRVIRALRVAVPLHPQWPASQKARERSWRA